MKAFAVEPWKSNTFIAKNSDLMQNVLKFIPFLAVNASICNKV